MGLRFRFHAAILTQCPKYTNPYFFIILDSVLKKNANEGYLYNDSHYIMGLKLSDSEISTCFKESKERSDQITRALHQYEKMLLQLDLYLNGAQKHISKPELIAQLQSTSATLHTLLSKENRELCSLFSSLPFIQSSRSKKIEDFINHSTNKQLTQDEKKAIIKALLVAHSH